MPPYARDAGMTETEAHRLAARVRLHVSDPARVEPEGRYFIVTLETSSGRYALRDEADWAWLRRQVLGKE